MATARSALTCWTMNGEGLSTVDQFGLTHSLSFLTSRCLKCCLAVCVPLGCRSSFDTSIVAAQWSRLVPADRLISTRRTRTVVCFRVTAIANNARGHDIFGVSQDAVRRTTSSGDYWLAQYSQFTRPSAYTKDREPTPGTEAM